MTFEFDLVAEGNELGLEECGFERIRFLLSEYQPALRVSLEDLSPTRIRSRLTANPPASRQNCWPSSRNLLVRLCGSSCEHDSNRASTLRSGPPTPLVVAVQHVAVPVDNERYEDPPVVLVPVLDEPREAPSCTWVYPWT